MHRGAHAVFDGTKSIRFHYRAGGALMGVGQSAAKRKSLEIINQIFLNK